MAPNRAELLKGSTFLVGMLVSTAARFIPEPATSAALQVAGSTVASQGARFLMEQIRTPQGRKRFFNHDLAGALRRALRKALHHLERDWKDHHGRHLERADPPLALLCQEQFGLLRAHAERKLTLDALQEELGEEDLREIVGGDSLQLGRMLTDALGLDQQVFDHDSRLRGFLENHLVEYWQLAFLDELKDPRTGTEAFRAYQIGFYSHVDQLLEEIRREQGEQESTRRALREVQASLERLERVGWIPSDEELGGLQSARDELGERFSLGAVVLQMDVGIRSLQKDVEALRLDMRAQLPSIHLWTDGDVAPEVVTPGDILVGERPQPFHLREGYLANRPEVYADLLRQVESWMEGSDARRDRQRRLPVCWIGGRSGSGKSAALLWTAASLHRRRKAPVYYLGSHFELLPAALRLVREREVRPILVLDDPYPPARDRAPESWSAAVAELAALRQAEAVHYPWILCCGPSEHAERLQERHVEDVLLREIRLPKTSPEDVRGLREFFHQRTGQLPPEGPAENVLLVQLFFEWSRGESLAAFARRFRERLASSDPEEDLTSFLEDLLALNRLYVGYPSQAAEAILTRRQRTKLARLREEEHLSEGAGTGRSGIWLAHAHLANAIYEAWGLEPLRVAEHYERVLRLCHEHAQSYSERTAPIWAMAQALGDEETAGRLDRVLIDRVLRERFVRLRSRADQELPIPLLPAWVEVAATLGWSFDDDPILLGLRRLQLSSPLETGAPLLCRKLLEHLGRFEPERQRGIAGIVTAWLLEHSDWEGWPSLAVSTARVTLDRRLRERVVQRLGDGRLPDWGTLWLRLWREREAEDLRDGLVPVALRRLEGEPECPRWSQIWEALEDHLSEDDPRAAGLRECAERWLPGREDQVHAAFVWKRLLARAARENREEDLQKQLRRGLRLLPPLRERRAWSFVYEQLVEHVPADSSYRRRILEVGLHWLAGHEQVGGWSHAWERLVGARRELSVEQRDGLLRLGLDWLEGREDWPDWPIVFGVLIGARRELLDPADRTRLRDRGAAWVREHETLPGWTRAWQRQVQSARLEKDAEQLTTLARQGVRTLRRFVGSQEWAFQAEVLLDLAPQLPDDIPADTIAAELLRWLQQEGDNPQWPPVWGHLVRERAELATRLGPERMASIGIAWLRRNENSSRFASVAQGAWLLLCPEVPAAEVRWLLERSKAWIRSDVDGRGSTPLLLAMMHHGREQREPGRLDAALKLGLEVLRESKRPRPRLWRQLLVHREEPAVHDHEVELFERGLADLRGELTPGQQAIVWRALAFHFQRHLLFRKRTTADGLLRPATQWLAKNRSDPSWQPLLYDALKLARVRGGGCDVGPILEQARLHLEETVGAGEAGLFFDRRSWWPVWLEAMELAGRRQVVEALSWIVGNGLRALDLDKVGPSLWPAVVSRILRNAGPAGLAAERERELVAQCRAWVADEDRLSLATYGHVMRQLLYRLPSHDFTVVDPLLIRLALRWLEQGAESSAWPGVWWILWGAAVRRGAALPVNTLFDEAEDWLNAEATPRDWPRVWHRLWEEHVRRGPSDRMREHLLRGLQRALHGPLGADWGAVTVGVLEGRRELGAPFAAAADLLKERALRWLRTERGRRSFYWPLCLKALHEWDPDPALLEEGRQWAEAVPIDRFALSAVLELLLRAHPDPAITRELGWSYLEKVPRHRSGWTRIFRVMKETGDDGDRLRLRKMAGTASEDSGAGTPV